MHTTFADWEAKGWQHFVDTFDRAYHVDGSTLHIECSVLHAMINRWRHSLMVMFHSPVPFANDEVNHAILYGTLYVFYYSICYRMRRAPAPQLFSPQIELR